MGSIINAVCKCGYQVHDCFVGVGMDYTQSLKNPEPAICFHCSSLQIVNYNSQRPRCSTCKKEIHFYLDDSALSTSPSGEAICCSSTYLCPKCGKMDMEFNVVGVWD